MFDISPHAPSALTDHILGGATPHPPLHKKNKKRKEKKRIKRNISPGVRAFTPQFTASETHGETHLSTAGTCGSRAAASSRPVSGRSVVCDHHIVRPVLVSRACTSRNPITTCSPSLPPSKNPTSTKKHRCILSHHLRGLRREENKVPLGPPP
ncbi:hypothetical protein M433DRAFT_309575, partial [Acidomyces richmondensis BFW]